VKRHSIRLVLLTLFIIVSALPVFGLLTEYSPEENQLFLFDPEWQGKGDSPFVQNGKSYALKVNIGAAYRMVFPAKLDSHTPIVIHTKYGGVKQFLQGPEVYQAELSGRYLVYRGKEQSILFRYDQGNKAFREFVYLPSAESLKEDGVVIRWRYEGANLSQRQDGSVAFTHTSDPRGDITKMTHFYSLSPRS